MSKSEEDFYKKETDNLIRILKQDLINWYDSSDMSTVEKQIIAGRAANYLGVVLYNCRIESLLKEGGTNG